MVPQHDRTLKRPDDTPLPDCVSAPRSGFFSRRRVASLLPRGRYSLTPEEEDSLYAWAQCETPP